MTRLEEAHKLGLDGRAVIPIHTPAGGMCSCTNDPCSSPGKHPRTAHGLKDATKDPAQITALWTRWPDANIGIATGAASGIVVLDVDPKNGGNESLAQLEAVHGALPRTPTVITGSGGRHFYFKHPGGHVPNSAGKIGRGLDLRGDGGYVVAPPSSHASGNRYAWATGLAFEQSELAPVPEWVFTPAPAREPQRDPESPARDSVRSLAWPSPAGQKVVADYERALAKHGPAIQGRGGDDHTFKAAAMGVHDRALTVEEALPPLERWNSTNVPPWSSGELRKKLENALHYGGDETSGDRRWAIEVGFVDGSFWEEQKEPEGAWESNFAQAKLDLEARLGGRSNSSASRRVFEPATDLLDRQFPKVPWLVAGILMQLAVAVIAGEPKTTKTWLALALALAIASGTPACGEFQTETPKQVALFLAEDSARSARTRLVALAEGAGLNVREVLGRVHVECQAPGNLQDNEWLAGVIASLRMLPEPPALVVLDPLRDLHQAEENESGPMADVMNRLRALRDLVGCAVLFVHHLSKASGDTKSRRAGQRMRGSSAIHGSIEGGIYLSDLDTDGRGHFHNTVDVELKAAQGAGQFTLALNIEDDMMGEAVKARWTFGRPDRAAEEAAVADEQIESVLRFLRELWCNHAPPVGVEAIRAAVGGAKQRVTRALDAAAARGRIRRVLTGGNKVLGWEYVPEAGESRAPVAPILPFAGRVLP